MLTKESLQKEFSKNYKLYYEVEVFKENGFERRKCECGRYFWSAEKNECGDSSHTLYTFLKKRNAERYVDFWKRFSNFFEKNGHAVINRYPVVSRWRPDLYFTICSIQDFQRVEKGMIRFEYPANPLIVPQISLRFNDIGNVGITGRHFSSFMMAGQHAFNYPKEGYWKDECIRLNYEFLTKILGVKEEELTYIEDVWAMGDFSAFGPCMESFSNGLELVNSVFMQFGLQGGAKKELEMKVIDVGWGFERLLWYYNGDLTAYDSVFPEEIAFMEKKAGFEVDRELFQKYASVSSSLNIEEAKDMREEERKIANILNLPVSELKRKILPLQGIYALADHSRTLLFAISDGSLPSNVGGGYNLRVILRRALSFIEEYGFDFSIKDIMEIQAKSLKNLFPELVENLECVNKIVEVEKERYGKSREKAGRIITKILEKNEALTVKQLISLYESNGITPELIENVANKMNKEIRIPTEFYSKIMRKEFERGEVEKEMELPFCIPFTKELYYEGKMECDAEVIDVVGDYVILNQTVFYPEGGGQACDMGEINGKEVNEVRKIGDVVIHKVKGSFSKGERVYCKVDRERRASLIRHHTATHILNAICRKLIGSWVWQAGAKKEKEKAHLDITHYEKLSSEKLREIELEVNKVIMENKKVNITFMERGEAEKKYGFILYQGGGAPGRRIRVVEIDGIDAEACGGLHVKSTGEIGLIKIIKDERIQDGVNRIEFCAGEEAVKFVQKKESILENASDKLRVSPENLPFTAERFFEEWKKRGKMIEELEEIIAEGEAEEILKEKGMVKKILNIDVGLMEKIGKKVLEKGGAALLVNKNGNVICVCSSQSGLKANEVLKELCEKFGGSGGGNEMLARGKITTISTFEERKKGRENSNPGQGA